MNDIFDVWHISRNTSWLFCYFNPQCYCFWIYIFNIARIDVSCIVIIIVTT